MLALATQRKGCAALFLTDEKNTRTLKRIPHSKFVAGLQAPADGDGVVNVRAKPLCVFEAGVAAHAEL